MIKKSLLLFNGAKKHGVTRICYILFIIQSNLY